MKKIIFTIFGMVLILAIFFLIYFLRPSVPLVQGLSLKISGEKEVQAGKNANWLLEIENRSAKNIEILNLTFKYPQGTFDKNGNLKRREEIKDFKKIPAGESFERSFSGIIFGKKGEIKKIRAILVYRQEGFSSIYEKTKEFEFLITQNNILLEIEAPKKVLPNQKFNLIFYFKSYFEFPLTNAKLQIFFPNDFLRDEKKLQNEEKFNESSIFDLGVLNSGEGGKVIINGYFEKEKNEEILFKAIFGKLDEKTYKLIPLAEREWYLKVKNPSFDLTRKINGVSQNYIAQLGEKLNYILSFKNKTSDVYENLNLIVELEGESLDFSSIKAPGGEVEKKRIIFSGKNIPSLNFLGPYGEGSVGFEIKIKDEFQGKNQKIIEKIFFGNVQKSFETKIGSKVSLKEKIYFNLPSNLYDKFFLNTGPFPFEKNQETTLLFLWEIKNQGNDLEKIEIKTTFLPKIEISEEKFPRDANFVFNKEKNELSLLIDKIDPNFEGFFGIKIKVRPQEDFQSINAKTTFEAKDSFTNQKINLELPPFSVSQIK